MAVLEKVSKSGGDDNHIFIKRIGFWSGPLLFLIIFFFVHPQDMSRPAMMVMAVTAWIAIWWITESVPLPVTSLLPIVCFPLLGITRISATTSAYGHPLVFLFIGGFLLAIAIEKTGLHTRMALHIIRGMGERLHMIVLGFMLATGFLSMWISNTATAVMMLPIGLAIVHVASDGGNISITQFRKALMLAIAYSASIGGMATLIGTPPNLVLAGIVKDMYGTEISFVQWMMVGLPLAIVLMIIAWIYLTRFGYPMGKETLQGGKAELDRRLSGLGVMSSDEKKVTAVFVSVAIAWIIRSFVLQKFIPGLDDTIIAVTGGVLLFIIPADNYKYEGILTWQDAVKLPWGIILLFGGGLALADAFESSGLAAWIGTRMTGLSVMDVFMLILLVVAIVNFLTEFTSNLATITIILPVVAPIAVSAGIHPYMVMVGAAMAASCGFMMPAATPPNAIAFGSGHLKIWDMVSTGFFLNLVSIFLITCTVYFLLEWFWGL